MTTTTTTQPLAYRCTKCFQTRCSSVDLVGQNVACELCGHQNTVPPATPDRIAQGESFLQQSATGAISQVQWSESTESMTDEEIRAHCRQQTIAKSGVQAVVVSKLQRFLGRLIDSALFVFAVIAAALLGAVIAPPAVRGGEPTPLAIALIIGIPITLQLIQTVLIATEGRTIGKYCVNAKIVDWNGNPPGFVRGVLLRSFLNCFLGIIPFYGLVDALFIFSNDANRCLHDCLAGTHVIHGD